MTLSYEDQIIVLACLLICTKLLLVSLIVIHCILCLVFTTAFIDMHTCYIVVVYELMRVKSCDCSNLIKFMSYTPSSSCNCAYRHTQVIVLAMASDASPVLDKHCSFAHIVKTSEHIENWQELAPYFGITEAEEQEILNNHAHQYKLQKRKMVWKWLGSREIGQPTVS